METLVLVQKTEKWDSVINITSGVKETKCQFEKLRYETVLQTLHQVWREQSTSSRNRDMRQCYKHYIKCVGNKVPVRETEIWDSVTNITSGVKETSEPVQETEIWNSVPNITSGVKATKYQFEKPIRSYQHYIWREGNTRTTSKILVYEPRCCKYYSRCGGYANIQSKTQYVTHDVITIIPGTEEMPLDSI
jgi:hypothetical protein